MPRFGEKSKTRLNTCHEDLQRLFNVVIETWDCTVLEGKRTAAQQKKNIERGVSQTMKSKHVYPLDSPSLAVDVAPFPLKWPKAPPENPTAEQLKSWMKDWALFYYFSGYVLGIAERMGIGIRHGADWNGDRDIQENRFDDLVHFELTEV